MSLPWSPTDVKKKYPRLKKKQTEVWAQVANKALDSGDDESTAIKKANTAVNNMRKTEALVESLSIVEEIGKSISAANMKALKASFDAMKAALETISPLLADDADADTNEAVVGEAEAETKKWESVNLEEVGKVLAKSDSYDSIRYSVTAALRKRAISDSIASKMDDGAYLDYYDYYSCSLYVQDMYDDYVVYCMDGELYQCTYTVSNDSVELGDPVEVKVSYVPTSTSDSNTAESSIEVKGDLIVLSEKAVRDDGTAKVCLITPGWGSSGYYSKEMLKRDGPKVFPAGTHMYMNHPTEEEDRNRPERDVKDLAGIIKSEPKWESGAAGEGLYADVEVFSSYRNFIDEAAPYIGTSIRAGGTAVEGAAEGRHGLLIDSLKEGYSVDYVTMAGRGGSILPLYESARKNIVAVNETTSGSIEVVTSDKTEVYNMDITKEELDALKESARKADTLETTLKTTTDALATATNQIARMQEAMILNEARTIVASTLATIELPNITRDRLLIECARTIPMKEGALDSDKLVEDTKAKAIEEMKYLETITGSVTGGKVVGMVSSPVEEVKEEDVDQALTEAWKSIGLDIKTDTTKMASIGRGR